MIIIVRKKKILAIRYDLNVYSTERLHGDVAEPLSLLDAEYQVTSYIQLCRQYFKWLCAVFVIAPQVRTVGGASRGHCGLFHLHTVQL